MKNLLEIYIQHAEVLKCARNISNIFYVVDVVEYVILLMRCGKHKNNGILLYNRLHITYRCWNKKNWFYQGYSIAIFSLSKNNKNIKHLATSRWLIRWIRVDESILILKKVLERMKIQNWKGTFFPYFVSFTSFSKIFKAKRNHKKCQNINNMIFKHFEMCDIYFILVW